MTLTTLRRWTASGLLGVAGLGVLVAAPSYAAPASSRAVTTCDIKRDGRTLGTTYVTSLKTTRVSCPKAKGVVKAFNRCRKAHGGADGTCRSSVQGFRCTEKRGAAIPTQYSSRVTCRSAAQRVQLAYTQFT
jgi:hypothetical protein